MVQHVHTEEGVGQDAVLGLGNCLRGLAQRRRGNLEPIQQRTQARPSVALGLGYPGLLGASRARRRARRCAAAQGLLDEFAQTTALKAREDGELTQETEGGNTSPHGARALGAHGCGLGMAMHKNMGKEGGSTLECIW